MKHKLNSFSGAFEGTTKGLEGIANALKREEPTPPPYVPTGFPCYIKTTRLSDGAWFIYEIDNVEYFDSEPQWNYVSRIIGSIYSIQGIESWAVMVITNGGIPSIDFYMDSNIVEINFITYDIHLLNDSYTVEWVDPLTLPQ